MNQEVVQSAEVIQDSHGLKNAVSIQNAEFLQNETVPLSLGVVSPLDVEQSNSLADGVISALLRCVSRWGLTKTTIEDVAKEAGVSRATVYRMFPGGKNSIMRAAVLSEVRSLLAVLTDELAAADSLESCLSLAIHHSAQFLDQHQALSFMRDHERSVLDQLISFEQLDLLFLTAAQVMKPVLSRFIVESEALAVGMWVSRLIVSYVSEPSEDFDLCNEHDAHRLVRTFLLPGITASSSAVLTI